MLDLVKLAGGQAHDYSGRHLSKEVHGDLELLEDGYSASSDAFKASFQAYVTAWT